MKEKNKLRTKYALRKMKNGGLHFSALKKVYPNSSDRANFMKFLKKNSIVFEKIFLSEKAYDFKLKLKSSLLEAFEKIEEESEYGLISKKYDFTQLLNELKEKLLFPEDVCKILSCSKSNYRNIITYLTGKYPIYEEDDERVGLLT